jgi:hypothetical protein
MEVLINADAALNLGLLTEVRNTVCARFHPFHIGYKKETFIGDFTNYQCGPFCPS